MNALLESEVQSRLASLTDWVVNNGLLKRVFTFSSYADGVAFVTHSAGGLTALDFDAAEKVSGLA